VVLAVLV